MCSISGEINYLNGIKRAEYHEQMRDSLKRRGPDQDDIYSDDNAVLMADSQ